MEEARADAGEIKFEVNNSLRQTWLSEQKLDPSLAKMLTPLSNLNTKLEIL